MLMNLIRKLFSVPAPVPAPVNRQERRTRLAIARKQAARRKRQ